MPVRCLKEHRAALEIGEDWITVAQMSPDRPGGFQRLLRAARTRRPPGEPDAELAQAIRRLWRSARIGTRSVNVCCRSTVTALRTFSFPSMPEEELRSALRLEAAELLNLPVEEAVFDWHASGGGSERLEGLLVASARADVEDLLRILAKAGLYPVLLTPPGLALARLCAQCARREGGEGDHAMLNIAGKQADVVVVGPHRVYPRLIGRSTGTWEGDVEQLTTCLMESLRYARFALGIGDVRRVWLAGGLNDGPVLAERIGALADVELVPWDPAEHLGLRLRRGSRQGKALAEHAAAFACSFGLCLFGN